jgi:2-polyprenyl-6-methoxyphenol hydroxylase-like FAD-dependent oxidoreductase
MAPKPPPTDRKHAIVIGGSMAGLLAARVLSDYYHEVTIVERDRFPDGAEQRRGVPQGRHTHGLLASGRDVLERFFPDISDALIRSGAVAGDIMQNCRWFFEGACLARSHSGLKGLAMTRPFLETKVRERVLALPNVRACDNTRVERLAVDSDSNRVTGVQIDGRVLAADLTVDATGRGSRSPEWLASMGLGKPAEERVEVGLSYTTRFFRRRPADLDGDIAVVIPPTPHGKRGGVMLAQEGDRWTVTLMVHFGKPAPEDLSGFIEFARTLPAPYIHQVIQSAEPLGECAVARFPASVRRRYEALAGFPDGYLVFGDAISSFNPIYGQGISAAALQAVELGNVLAEGRDRLAARFFARSSKVIDIPWSIAAGNDLRIPEAVGPRPPSVKIINWYMAKLHKAAHADAEAALAFHKVGNLLAPPPSVMYPRVALRVLWGNLRPARPAVPETSRSAAGGR